ncbi:conjugative transposon protein TraM [Flavobacterium seoulense]|uniref:Conjugal transfer protein TraM n=1 Tax=Flavobacterium seoulense TaxID=1492738 RepID=A0A066WLC0_9FLAO|nr:conjugative transposon protein TraM [Flavobacterium seoulense]KDN54666.1 conjugal transfer protein TraM [Flavobacterium seoulense]
MENKRKSIQMLRQRKLFLVAPLLTLPFFTLLFWLLGGGKMETTNAQSLPEKGFNVQLPNPKFKETTSLDKMSYYDAAALDSVKLEELIKKDPNYVRYSYFGDSTEIVNESIGEKENSKRRVGGLNTAVYHNPNEEKVYAKLAALQKVINQPPQVSRQQRADIKYENSSGTVIGSKDVDRLEQMMQSMNESDAEDPELQKLSGMLENILDIQHPDRVQEKLRKVSEANRGQVFSISTKEKDNSVTLLRNTIHSNETGIQVKSNAFYSFEETQNEQNNQNAVEAVIHESQIVVNGSTVKLRLVNPIFINGILIPKEHFFFGVASLKGERLTIKINSLRYTNSIFPVDLSVYDMDGLKGIYIPGAINRDVAKSSADRSIQTLGVTSLDDSWGAQAAGMGIETAKNLLSKKVKLVKVVVKAGYKVFIYDEKQKQQITN